MAIKVVILCQQVTNIATSTTAPQATLPSGSAALNYSPRVHTAGWTESIWFNADNVTQLLQALTTGLNQQPGLLPARALLMAQNASIIGVRLYAGGAGRGQSYAYSFPGYPGAEADNPQQAALVLIGSINAVASRRFTVRAIPDYMITQGELDVGSTGTVQTWQGYFSALSNFAFRALDGTQPKAPVFAITSQGTVTLSGNTNPFAANQIVTLNNGLNQNQNRVKFTGTIGTVGPGQQLTLNNWTGQTINGGTLSVKSYILYSISPSSGAIRRLVTRKVGRPFELYRGRRSKRRRNP